ncbi:MAG: proteasome subunit beta [Candidatus Nanohalarchaeota archaeon]|nr:MAG: proteasome subunit beta [Candidatus Nanohaloarchaeota archaeon]
MVNIETLKTGTTTVAMICSDGVVLAADQKATMGSLVASKDTQKVFEVSPKMCMTMAGSAGDGQAMARLLRAELTLYELQEKKITVRAGATLLSNILRGAYKSFIPEYVQLVLGGYDARGPQLYSVDAAGGLSPEEEYAFSGSGSVIALGVLEDGYKKGMSTEQGVKLLLRSIKAARERDVYTGGKLMHVAVVTKDGIKWITEKEIKEIIAKLE